MSRTIYAKPIFSGIIGHFDRTARTPYCRTTAFTRDNVERWRMCLPFIRAINGLFRRTVPDRYEAQASIVNQTASDWVIPGTAFTTVTVNKNYRTGVHRDAGDLKQGFGVLSAIRAGDYSGGYLVFPKYRVAVDMRTTDVLFADVHEAHGNTEMIGTDGQWERISTVMYYRERMRDCGSAAEERERLKHRQPGDPLM